MDWFHVVLGVLLIGLSLRLSAKVGRIEKLVRKDIREGRQAMALGQDILDQIAAEKTLIDSVVALLNGLVANGTIDAATKDAIMAGFAGNKAELEAALAAGVPPTP